MAMTIPPVLKPVTQYVRRAEKLDRAQEAEAPVVAYYCRLYATDQAMNLNDNSQEAKIFLASMLDRLEEDKKRGLSGFTREEGQKMTLDWAMKEFNAADEEDRAGLADQGTARTFYAAGVFFDVLRQFGEPDESMDRRRLYCKWKASQILKAIKEGRTPTPGGAGEDVDTGMPSVGGGAPGDGASGAGSGTQDMGGQPASSYPSSTPDQSASAESPTPHNPLAGIIPEAPTDNPFLNTDDAPRGSGGGGGGMTPAYSPVESYQPPPPSIGGGGPNTGGGISSNSYPATDHPATGGYSPSPYAAPGPSPAPHVVPEAPAPAPAPARRNYSPMPPQPRTPVPSSAGSRRATGGRRPMEGNMADAIEHCRFAIRALEKKDVDLAVQRLHEALEQIT